jgi:hypothetical protein
MQYTHILKNKQPGMVIHTCNPSTQEAETEDGESSRPTWATYLDPVSNKTKTKQIKNKFPKDITDSLSMCRDADQGREGRGDKLFVDWMAEGGSSVQA